MKTYFKFQILTFQTFLGAIDIPFSNFLTSFGRKPDAAKTFRKSPNQKLYQVLRK